MANQTSVKMIMTMMKENLGKYTRDWFLLEFMVLIQFEQRSKLLRTVFGEELYENETQMNDSFRQSLYPHRLLSISAEIYRISEYLKDS